VHDLPDTEHALPDHDDAPAAHADAEQPPHGDAHAQAPPAHEGDAGDQMPPEHGTHATEMPLEHDGASGSAPAPADASAHESSPNADAAHAATAVLRVHGPILTPGAAHEIAEFGVGLLRGLADSASPLGIGGTAPTPMDHSKPFEVGRGVAQIGVGVTEVVTAVRGEVGGLLLDVTGVGTAAGVALNIGSAALAVQGVATITAGLHNLGSGGGSGGGGDVPVAHDSTSSQAPPSDHATTTAPATGEAQAPPHEGPANAAPGAEAPGAAHDGPPATPDGQEPPHDTPASDTPSTQATPDNQAPPGDPPATPHAQEPEHGPAAGADHPPPEAGHSPDVPQGTYDNANRLAPPIDAPHVGDAHRITPGALDAHGRPTGVDCVLKKSDLRPDAKGTNPDPAVGIERGIGYDVTHLLAREFGGTRSPENLTAGSQLSNRQIGDAATRPPSMRDVEIKVGQALNRGETVHYNVQLVYDGSSPYPSAFHMQARGSGPDGLNIDTVVRNWTHHR
jgi:hypothetical protein